MMDGRPALGSATRSPSIMDERAVYGGPRFYPPGEHPATYRLRCDRDRCAALLNKWPMAAFTAPDAYRQTCEMLAYIEERLAAFEAGEDEAKRRAWFYVRERANDGDIMATSEANRP